MTREKLCNHICYTNNVMDCGNVDCADCQAKLAPLLDKYEQTIRADERAKVVKLLNEGNCLFDFDEYGETLHRNDEFFFEYLEYLETLTDDFDKYVDNQMV